ncbi:MAG: C39 family peptidase [Erysipelotrichaceae bacterium]|nr:C39 family peptidase [Erysipelotrichaceae bacterium]
MMKKILLGLILLGVLAFTVFFFKNVFFPAMLDDPVTIGQSTNAVQNDSKEETVSENETETTVVTEQNGIELIANDPNENGTLYRMLDFDRRLILQVGQQDEYLCSIFCLAYARGILDGKTADPYDYYDGDGAVWRLADYEDVALSDPLEKVLQKAYDEIEAGRPVILFTSGTYAYIPGHEEYSRTTGDHYVLLIGHRMDADYQKLKASDFYAADPTRGYSDNEETFMPWVVLTEEAPALVHNEYALYASMDQTKHVKTCIAYADSCTWNSDLKVEILPDYQDQKR